MTPPDPDRDSFFSDEPERRFAAGTPAGQARSLGQVFTPFKIAEFMARWVTAGPGGREIFDPAAGLGVFFRAALRLEPHAGHRFTGCEVDPRALEAACRLFDGQGLPQPEWIEGDYLRCDWDRRYPAILCNPPYQRFQNYPDRETLLREVQSRLGLSLSGLTNLHTLFLLKSVHQLAPGGRMAYILPSEFLNAGYGEPVKRYLLESGSLRYVLVFDFAATVFEDALTTACILLFARDGRDGRVEFAGLDSLAALDELGAQLAAYPQAAPVGQRYAPEELDPRVKWRAYYQRRDATEYHGLVPLSAYGRVMRGIATGDNAFFTLRESERERFGLDERVLLPCLARASHAPQPFFTLADFERLRQQDKKVYLLEAAAAPDDPAVKAYLAHGERGGSHRRYLTRHRKPWYALEQRDPAPFLVTVFHRNGLRFVRNEAGVRSLTCFHSLYLNPAGLERIELLSAYLLTRVAGEIFSRNRREYGGGLKKFEPNDLNSAEMIDLRKLTAAEAGEAVRLLRAARSATLAGAPEMGPREALDALFREVLLRPD